MDMVDGGGGGGGGGFFLSSLSTRLHPIPLVLQLYKFKSHDCHNYQSLHYNYVLSTNSYVAFIGTASTTRCSRWDPNVETNEPTRFGFKNQDKTKTVNGNDGVRGGSFRKRKKRRWWSDEPPSMEEEEVGIFEEVIDGLWILKVFRSYGWTLPPILISFLLATGPKAFFTVLAISIGLSALFFAIEKLFGRTKDEPKRKASSRKGTSAKTSRYAAVDDDEQEEEKQDKAKGKMGHQSWVGVENGSFNKYSRTAAEFGGWDELDRIGSMPRPTQSAARHQRKPSPNGKLRKRRGKREAPLLLRLLTAVFPFLSFWTNMLDD